MVNPPHPPHSTHALLCVKNNLSFMPYMCPQYRAGRCGHALELLFCRIQLLFCRIKPREKVRVLKINFPTIIYDISSLFLHFVSNMVTLWNYSYIGREFNLTKM